MSEHAPNDSEGFPENKSDPFGGNSPDTNPFGGNTPENNINPLGQQPSSNFDGKQMPSQNPQIQPNNLSQSGEGITGVIIGIVSFIFICIPIIGIVIAAVGTFLSFRGYNKNKLSNSNIALPISGIILNSAALILGFIYIIFWIYVLISGNSSGSFSVGNPETSTY